MRDCFQAEEDEDWGKLDFPLKKPRIGVHIAERHGIRGAKEMADQYRANPKFDMHGEVAKGMNIPKRGDAKIDQSRYLVRGGRPRCATALGCPRNR